MEIFRNVERLWQADTIPYVSERTATRSKQDPLTFALLQKASTRVDVDGTLLHATPLFQRTPAVTLHAPKNAVLPSLRNTERRLHKDPGHVDTYCKEIHKVGEAGYMAKISLNATEQSPESWFTSHHIVQHNGKDRIVFNCSFAYRGQSLNDQLFPGLALGPSLLGVLLRFRQHTVVVSGDIKGMFHQIRLLPADPPEPADWVEKSA